MKFTDREGHFKIIVKRKPFRPAMSMVALLEETHQQSAYIRALGYELNKIWECEWYAQYRDNPQISAHLKTKFPPTAVNDPNAMS